MISGADSGCPRLLREPRGVDWAQFPSDCASQVPEVDWTLDASLVIFCAAATSASSCSSIRTRRRARCFNTNSCCLPSSESGFTAGSK